MESWVNVCVQIKGGKIDPLCKMRGMHIFFLNVYFCVCAGCLKVHKNCMEWV